MKPPLDLAAAVPLDFGALARDVPAAMETDADGAATGLYPGYVESVVRDQFVQTQQTLAAKMPGFDVGDVVGEARILPSGSSVLAAGLPYELVTRGASWSALPPNLRHSVTLTLTLYASSLDRALDAPDLQYTSSLPALGSRRLSVTYAPATAADAQLIQSYVDAGAQSLPVYLIQVVPRIELDGVSVAQGTVATMGEAQACKKRTSDCARGILQVRNPASVPDQITAQGACRFPASSGPTSSASIS